METPIADFIKDYTDKAPVRLHMPGHKGDAAILGAPNDITEVEGTSDLIFESEKNASSIFGCPTYYSAEGSSLCIRAMLSLLVKHTGCHTVVAARNCHQTFISACALLDLDVIWLPNEWSLLSNGVDLPSLDKILSDNSACCVYITSPDYLGFVNDISSIASVCHSHDTYLAVDNAHGAYLKFFSQHPMDLGADICCDSSHKTLPVLTGGAYLHVSDELNKLDVKRELSLYASTSPSWLILASLDRANAIISDPDFASGLKRIAAKVEDIQSSVKMRTYGNEYLKLTLAPNTYGYTGDEVADILRTFGIEPEFSDVNYVTLMFSSFNSDKDFEVLTDALISINMREPLDVPTYTVPTPTKVKGIREAVFGKTEVIPVIESEGRVAGFVKTSCPPAVPIVICGEKITLDHIKALKAYGFMTIEVCCDIE